MRGCIDEVLNIMDCLAKAKQLKLEAAVPKDLRVRSDKTKLKQILINIVNNGIKFTASGGIFITVEQSPGQPRFNIRVRDTGIGIKAEDLPSLFQEFKQLDSSPTREYGGTGLGLVISRKFAQLMGGDVCVESVPVAGSTFTITLPLESDQQAQVMENPFQAAAAAGPRGKIFLAIDDDPEVLALLRDSLHGSGYEFAGALSAEEGIAMARKLKPFAITLDIMMPHKDGWSALLIMKNDPVLQKIPVIILSIMDNKILGYALGVTDYILKPFERGELLKKLKALDHGAPGGAPGVTPRTALIADGEKEMAESLKGTLAAEGYTVEVVDNGSAALARLNAAPPDILFLDLMLPGANGLEITEAMEKDPKFWNTVVFILTARHLTPQETDYLQKRTEAVIQKGSKNLSEILGLVGNRLKALEAADER